MESNVKYLEEQILNYLMVHPHAADTAVGIATWWLQYDGHVKLSLVQKALDNLLEKNIIISRKSLDGHILYSKGNL